MENGDALLFGRYTREECGLLPVRRGPALVRRALRGALVLAALICAGCLAGRFTAHSRQIWMADLPRRVLTAPAEDVSGLLEQGRMYAAAQPENMALRRNLALAVCFASSRQPRPLGYLANARMLFGGLGTEQPGTAREYAGSYRTFSAMFAELGDYRSAFQCAEFAFSTLDSIPDSGLRAAFRLGLINDLAYLLATAPAGDGGDPERALALAREMIGSRDRMLDGSFASDSAACMDTFAAALHAAGDSAQAAAAQRLALGLARTEELSELLRNYDLFAGNAALTR